MKNKNQMFLDMWKTVKARKTQNFKYRSEIRKKLQFPIQRKTFKNNSEVYSTGKIREMPQESKISIKEENLKHCF